MSLVLEVIPEDLHWFVNQCERNCGIFYMIKKSWTEMYDPRQNVGRL